MNIMNLVIFFLITLIFIFLIINSYKSMEFFNNKNYVDNTNIQSFILDDLNKDDMKQSVDNYITTFVQSKKNSNLENLKYLFNTHSLKSNKLNLFSNEPLDKNNKTLIVDVSYDKLRRLMVTGLFIDKNRNPQYHIYRKKTNKIKSAWEKLTLNPNIHIRSLCYDSKTSKLLAIDNNDGQIYEQKFYNNYDEWIGPINFDLPVKKIMYDKQNYLIGIGQKNGFIYKKGDLNWRKSEWDQNQINKTSVNDLIYDTDGCLIAATSKGVLKQVYPDFVSEFKDIRNYKEKNSDILSKVDILKFKIGFEFMDEIFNDSNLGKHLKKIYDIKKLTKDLCNSRKYNKKFKLKNDVSHSISVKNREISDLYDKIDKIYSKFNN